MWAFINRSKIIMSGSYNLMAALYCRNSVLMSGFSEEVSHLYNKLFIRGVCKFFISLLETVIC